MPERIETYLNELREALKAADPALVQDALWDAENHLRTELAASRWNFPEIPEAEALAKIIGKFGTPAEVAEAYRDREAVVASALRPVAALTRRPERPPLPEPDAPAPWPGFLEVLWTPKAYTSLLYSLLSLATGVFYFSWAVTGLSLSLGLIFIIIGIPFAIAFLGSVRVLALGEGRLVEALLDVRMPRRPALLPEGATWWQRMKNLLTDRHTWSSLAYLVLHMPMGILAFTLVVSFGSISLALIVAPIGVLLGLPVTLDTDVAFLQNHIAHPSGFSILCLGALGLAGVVGTLHLALGLGRVQGWLAKQMLVHR